MTQRREVLSTMDPQTTTFGRKQGWTISRFGGFLLGALFVLCLVITGLLAYHFAPCLEGKPIRTVDEFGDRRILVSARDFAAASLNETKIDVRLPKSIVPDSYEIILVPFIWKGNFTFNGEVKILVNVTTDTDKISIHATDMKIYENLTRVDRYKHAINETKNIKIVEQWNDTARQFHVIRTAETLKAGKQYVIQIKYLGYINDYLQGFYRSSYTRGNGTWWIAATQFQPTDARRAFPCFDEPALKATFQISIARSADMLSLSNMPMKPGSSPLFGPELPNFVWDHYERSVPMSTYLVAFVVTDFSLRKTLDGKFGVFARREALAQTEYSLDIGPRILKYYEDYFQIKFPLPKIDMVALPDFSAGAMENWGLITYRETAMLFKEGVSTSASKQRIATVVAHELAHQWFGNLVTPSWWTDLWLNEGFASYVEYIGMDSVEPSWKVLEQFVVHELQNVFSLDALESSHPISIEVGHPEEISEIFDRISYGKGASIIRMMDHFLTTKVFKQGLTNYLNEKAYQSAEQNDLWEALTKQAHKDGVLDPEVTVKQIMDTWTLQTGFPVITVTRNYSGFGSAVITQDRFSLRNSTITTTSKSEPLWWVPITYANSANLAFHLTQPSTWLKAQKSMKLQRIGAGPEQWVIFNLQQTGYYRVNYDARNWMLITESLKHERFINISTINRAQLIDDSLNLARAGRLDYATALELTSYLVRETEYVPWKAAFVGLTYLDNMLIKTEVYERFIYYVVNLLDHAYFEIGFQEGPDDPQLKIFTRMDMLSWACKFGQENCIRNSVRLFHEWRTSPDPDTTNPIWPNVKGPIYCTAIRFGGQEEWDFAWERYQKSNVGSEKDLLLFALGCSRETWLLSRYLKWAVEENSGIRKQDAPRVFNAVANNPIGQSLVFNFLRNNWDRIKRYCGTSLSTINHIVKSATRRISTEYELKDLLDFAKEHADELGSSTRTVQQAVEQAEGNVQWLHRNYPTIRDWLKKKKRNTVTSSEVQRERGKQSVEQAEGNVQWLHKN